jgi:hypothetical protein
MKRQWTLEQRAAHGQRIHQWKPWQKSTGPITIEGKAIVARNGFKGGQRIQLREETRQFKAVLKDHVEFVELLSFL